ncbi:hypothetical protein PH210_23860 [Paenibacillus sp. BSR1-1]|uniref:hypothetical protein n=1 Tax=Paenibacillus sp. BSR1-1 TaxID=3020845 RepID=UPI0025B04FC0|nr:hypothetical protein [Paenibacillus sp. BSR1-1]MDN3019211.1 hypothetical protein [Paenibacillus sp. BSR1-1]
MRLRLKFRMYVDYFRYLASIQKKETFMLLVDLVTFILSTFAFISQWIHQFEGPGFGFSIIMLFLLSLVKLGYDTYKMGSDIIKYKHSDQYEIKAKDKIIIYDEFLPLNDLIPSQMEERIHYEKVEIVHQNDFVFYSPKVDRHLRTTNLRLSENKLKGKKIKKIISDDKEVLIPFLNYQFAHSMADKKYFYNEQKLCLSEDLDITQIDACCHKGSYFDSFLTNHVSTKQLYSKSNNRVIYDGTNYFPVAYAKDVNELRLLEINFSDMNNEIGVSTLGFTADNYLVIWKQNAHAQSSNNLFVPTGSGSCDWKDIIDQDFTKTITNGMGRELWEESGKTSLGKSHRTIGKTKLLGFFRWVKRGGKPEFVGLTKLDVKASQLDPEIEEVRKSRSRHMWRIEDLTELKKVIKEIQAHKETSIPLFMCLKSLEVYMEENPEELRELLNIR